jgi:pre-mRNA-splicing helicase BRR2
MAFSQGGHLMSNKKCKLPDGSFKRSKKGYKEIHIPAPKKQPLVESEIVQTSQLPEWARKAFDGIKTLYRIQSSSIQSLSVRTIRFFFVLLLAQER